MEVCREVGCRGVGVVTADRVQDVDTVLGELLGRDVERVLALLDEPAPDAVGDIGELDARVADRAATVPVEQVCLLTNGRVTSTERPVSNPAYPSGRR